MRTIAWILNALLFGSIALAADITGTWKLVPEKSPGTDLVSSTMTLESIGPDTYTTTSEYVLKSGKAGHFQAVRIYDGKEHHVTLDGGDEGLETCEITPDGSRKITFKKDGKAVWVVMASYSADGKTMMHTRTNEKGSQVEIYERQ